MRSDQRMKHFAPMDENGNVKLSEEKLKELLFEAYREGYIQGEIDYIMRTAPDFATAEDRSAQKKKKFSESGNTIVFRATIL